MEIKLFTIVAKLNLETCLDENNHLMKMKDQIKDDVCKVKMKDLILKNNFCTAMVLVSVILNTQIRTSLRRLQQRTPPFINKY